MSNCKQITFYTKNGEFIQTKPKESVEDLTHKYEWFLNPSIFTKLKYKLLGDTRVIKMLASDSTFIIRVKDVEVIIIEKKEESGVE